MSKSTLTIWKSRLEEYVQETRKYMKYMFNDHLVIVLIFFLAGGASWYSQWLKNIPAQFPSYWVMAVVFAFILTSSYVRTLIKEADLVFMLPLEGKMEPYLKQAFNFSFITQLFPLVAAAIIALPLYIAVSSGDLMLYVLILAQMILIKGLNTAIQWRVTYFQGKNVRWLDAIFRFVLNTLLVYTVLQAAYVFAIVLYVLYAGYLIYLTNAVKKQPFQWELHISDELKRKQRFYRLANLFTDVPHLKKQVKRRVYMDWVLQFVPYEQRKTFSYMYVRAFLRSNDYFGLVIRLTLVFVLIILYTGATDWIGALLVLFTVFITGVQLVPLTKHFAHLSLQALYPVSQQEKDRSFFVLVRNVLIIQSILLSASLLPAGGWKASGLALLVSLAFVLVLFKPYVQGRLKKMR
ncbi:ABC transporter permease [Bacillus sp. 179-C3.3 HS]|uniref:ABC transporter permease n=1 Tax=Bacillus sp. 179-C3.3 HS TaxID=3232162 RepID=UPI0039A39333